MVDRFLCAGAPKVFPDGYVLVVSRLVMMQVARSLQYRIPHSCGRTVWYAAVP